MERRVKIICSIVGFLGLLSAATGFAAEAKRIKVLLMYMYIYTHIFYIALLYV